MTDDTRTERHTVLAVDDEERVGQAFDLWLDDYEVRTATSGSEALELMGEDVEVVLLDRHMPGMNGDEVLGRIREADYYCRVAMVTAVDPDFDIVEMPFDHYLSKPVDESDLRGVVAALVDFNEYDERMQELYAVSQKLATLEAEKNRMNLDGDERYERLRERQQRLQSDLDEMIADMESDEVADLFEPPGH